MRKSGGLGLMPRYEHRLIDPFAGLEPLFVVTFRLCLPFALFCARSFFFFFFFLSGSFSYALVFLSSLIFSSIKVLFLTQKKKFIYRQLLTSGWFFLN